jgi:hypothetical protein
MGKERRHQSAGKHDRKQNLTIVKTKYGKENRHSLANPNLLQQKKNETLEKESKSLDVPHNSGKFTNIGTQQYKKHNILSENFRDSNLVNCPLHNNNNNNNNKNKTMMNLSSTASTKEHVKAPKLHKREKHRSLSPIDSHTFSPSRSTPTVNEPIVEVDENVEKLTSGSETPKTPPRRKGSILSPGLAFDLVDGKLVVTAGTEDKLLKTLADPNYNGKQ